MRDSLKGSTLTFLPCRFYDENKKHVNLPLLTHQIQLAPLVDTILDLPNSNMKTSAWGTFQVSKKTSLLPNSLHCPFKCIGIALKI